MAKVFRIITSGAKEYTIANVLSAKISELGKYECTVWEEKKDYNANKATMSSSNYIIYIGPVKDAKALYGTGSINWKYDEEGMRYGWLGTKAVILVDPKFHNFGKFIDKVATKENSNNFSPAEVGLVAASAAVALPFGIGVGLAVSAKNLLGKKNENSDAPKEKEEKRDVLQCYKILIEKFIAEGLNEFMGE